MPRSPERCCKLTRRPGHFSSADDVTMQMGHGFARVRTVVEHEAKTIFGESKLFRDLSGFDQEMAEHLMIFRLRFGDTRNRFPRNHQHVDRCLRLYVLECDHLVVLVNNFCRDFARDNLFKKGFAHGV